MILTSMNFWRVVILMENIDIKDFGFDDKEYKIIYSTEIEGYDFFQIGRIDGKIEMNLNGSYFRKKALKIGKNIFTMKRKVWKLFH